MPASGRKVGLLALGRSLQLLVDSDPEIDYLLMSTKERLAYGLTEPTPVVTWSRSQAYGGQPDPATGAKVWFKAGTRRDADIEDDTQFWSALESIFERGRNRAITAESQQTDEVIGWLQKGFFITGPILALAGFSYIIKLLS